MTSAESAQANSYTIVTVQDQRPLFFVSQVKKKPVQNDRYKTLPCDEMEAMHKK